jgi:Ion channel
MLARPRRPFTALFFALLAAIVCRPLLASHHIGHVVFAGVMVLFFVAALRALCRTLRQRFVATSLGAVWLGARGLEVFLQTRSLPVEIVRHLAEIAFLAAIVALLIRAILHKHSVTLDNILGAFAGYLLIALTFGAAFSLVELLQPGSFRVQDALQTEWSSAAERDWVLNYFSCCTLMTVGYGDVTPVHAARTLAVLKAMTGQLYLAVLVAVLVGMRVAQGFFHRNDAASAQDASPAAPAEKK